MRFIMDVWAYVCAGWGFACWETDSYNLVDWDHMIHDPCAPSNCFGSQIQCNSDKSLPASGDPNGYPTSKGPLVSPRIASNGSGQALAVWIHDPCDPPTSVSPDVWYSYSPAPGTWTPPAPVDTTDDNFESDPRITFLEDQTTAILVVTQNQMTQGQADGAGHLSDILSEQELVSYKFTPPSTWTPIVGGVHQDTGTHLADGRAELTDGHQPYPPFVIWVRESDPCVVPPCNTDVMVSRLEINPNPPYLEWKPMYHLGGVGTTACCAEPDIAYDNLGNALAVWIRDEDGNPNTGHDRVIRAAYYNSTIWGTPFTAVAVDDPDLSGLLWPTVGFDNLNRPIIVFTTRGEYGNQLPGGGEYGEGTYDFLFTATWSDPCTAPFEQFDSVEPIGGPYQHRARWPRMSIANEPLPLAFIGARWFKGVGADGYDGEIAIFTKKVSSDVHPGGWWPKPALYTNDSELDWQIDLDADVFSNLVRIVWAKPLGANQILEFGSGFDGVFLIETPFDGDEIPVELDNCPDVYNPDQNDLDADGVGDLCDNCPSVYNPDQVDSDSDGMGDICDPNDDNDEILDDGDDSGEVGDHPCTNGSTDDCDDNCRTTENPGQEDSDNDGIGDKCECDAANIDGEYLVNLEDLAIITLDWLLLSGDPNITDPASDTNGDGVIDISDAIQVAQNWLCGPPCWYRLTQCHGDTDGIKNGLFWVSMVDLTTFTAAYDSVYPDARYDPCADFDRDGDVDIEDEAIIDIYLNVMDVPPDCEQGGVWVPGP
jgi:hypothetical protein